MDEICLSTQEIQEVKKTIASRTALAILTAIWRRKRWYIQQFNSVTEYLCL